MFGNGVMTGMGGIAAVLGRIRPVLPVARTAFSGVVVGATSQGAVAFRIGTASTLRTGTTLTGSASSLSPEFVPKDT